MKNQKIKKIKIGNRTYKLKEASVANDFEDYDYDLVDDEVYHSMIVLGQHSGRSRIIWVKKTALSKKERKEILFHEVTHALFYQMEHIDKRYFDFKPMSMLNHDERFIDDFSKILMKTFEIKSLMNKENEKPKKI